MNKSVEHKKFGTFRANLAELFTRVISIDKNKDKAVYWNGEDNQYPSEIERVVLNSPTAKRASMIMGDYVSGNGLEDESKDIIVNERKNYKLSQVISLAGQNVSKQGGVWFHIGYGLDDNLEKLIPRSLDVPDYVKFRKAKEDDDANEGKIYYKDYCDSNWFTFFMGKKVKDKWYYPYNNNQSVIKAQIISDYKASGGEETTDIVKMLPYYRGQIHYLNTTPEYKYALAPVDSVYNDADSEYRISLYTNKQVRTGFLGKTAVLTQGLDEETAKTVVKDISNWLGAENSDSVYHLDVEKAEDLDKVMKVIQLKAQFDEKLFSETNKKLQSNILGAYNSIPEILVLSSSGALFGANSETLKEAERFYSRQTKKYRNLLESTINFLGFPCKIKPIVEEVTEIIPSI